MSDDAPFPWAVVIPVKLLARAKSRIAPLAGPRRAELALAMASDTLEAVVASRVADQVLVVTDDPVAAAELAPAGAMVVPDEPRAGLNAALSYGAARALDVWPGSALAALSADLPALRASELDVALRTAAAWPEAFVPDLQGSGTTLYTAAPGAGFKPEFGLESRRRHAAGRRGRAAAAGHHRTAPGRGHAGRPAGRGAARAGPADGRARGRAAAGRRLEPGPNGADGTAEDVRPRRLDRPGVRCRRRGTSRCG